jgi:hypothetical protein
LFGPVHWESCSALSESLTPYVTLFVYCFLLYAGSYELLPYYKGENTVFDISPSSLSVSVEHSHLTIPQKFQVLPEIDSHLIVSGIEVSVKEVCLGMMKK